VQCLPYWRFKGSRLRKREARDKKQGLQNTTWKDSLFLRSVSTLDLGSASGFCDREAKLHQHIHVSNVTKAHNGPIFRPSNI
jgi:hypothetical protein